MKWLSRILVLIELLLSVPVKYTVIVLIVLAFPGLMDGG